jgi:hypothetical protein
MKEMVSVVTFDEIKKFIFKETFHVGHRYQGFQISKRDISGPLG